MNVKKKLDNFIEETFVYEKLEDVIGDRFGKYSKYIIQDRAIPDVRDGLKPVQRRILYAMDKMGITSSTPYKKSARIVGDVMGKYHPHGDSSIYEAMVRMSQNWKMSVTLIDMHGNNGSIDGDSPAAMRYTESRMSKNADYLLQDIDKNTVPFIPNFDEEETEPTVLPAKFPNLLVNGAMGISSGYATYIPTHNISEVIEAAIQKIDNPEMTLDELLAIMPGPDFPTGGIVQGLDGIREAFNTGSGSVIVRSKIDFEEINKDQKRIVVLEIPYDTNKGKIVERIDQLRIDKKVEDIVEVRDESDREGLRIAIDLKKGANEKAILNYLFKNTDLQINLKYNMVAINNRRPERLGVLKILEAYIEHQKDVITNRTNYELAKDKKRLHIVDGLMKMVSIVDEVIATIRASKNKADSKLNICEKFAFTEEQAEAIVMMQLYRLSTQDIVTLQNEHTTLNENIIGYNRILNSEKELLKTIKNELRTMQKVINCPRKTVIEEEISDIKIDETDLISKEQVMVLVSKEGYIKRINMKSYNISRVNTLKEHDSIQFIGEVSTLDTLLMFTDQGNFLYLPVYKIDECKTKDVGAFISSIISINPGEKIIKVFVVNDFKANKTLLLTTKQGLIKQTLLNGFELSRYTKAVKAMKLSSDDSLVSVDMIDTPYEIFVATKNCEGMRVRASEISLYGTSAGGIRIISMKPDDEVIGAFYANKMDDALLLTTRGYIKRVKIADLPLSRRARSATPLIKKVKSNPHLLTDAKKMSPNQYKEDVLIDIMYSDGNDQINAFELKYQSSDAGKDILKDGIGSPLKMTLPNPKEADQKISDDYLLDKSTAINLFSSDSETEVSLRSDKSTQSILDDLDKLLGSTDVIIDKPIDKKEIIETEQTVTTNTRTSTIVRKKDIEVFESKVANKNDDEDKKIPFKKISLFDE